MEDGGHVSKKGGPCFWTDNAVHILSPGGLKMEYGSLGRRAEVSVACSGVPRGRQARLQIRDRLAFGATAQHRQRISFVYLCAIVSPRSLKKGGPCFWTDNTVRLLSPSGLKMQDGLLGRCAKVSIACSRISSGRQARL